MSLYEIQKFNRTLLKQEVYITTIIISGSVFISFLQDLNLRQDIKNKTGSYPSINWGKLWSGVLNGVVISALTVLVWRAFIAPMPPYIYKGTPYSEGLTLSTEAAVAETSITPEIESELAIDDITY
jgi:hypothetical protein